MVPCDDDRLKPKRKGLDLPKSFPLIHAGEVTRKLLIAGSSGGTVAGAHLRKVFNENGINFAQRPMV